MTAAEAQQEAARLLLRRVAMRLHCDAVLTAEMARVVQERAQELERQAGDVTREGAA